MNAPQADPAVVADLVSRGLKRANEVSEGRLSDLSPASPVTTIIEAIAVVAAEAIAAANQTAATVEKDSIPAFGISRFFGTPATGTIEVVLDCTLSESFVLPSGTQITINGVVFKTQEDIEIPPFEDRGRGAIASVEFTKAGNVPQTADVSFAPIECVAKINLIGATSGGKDADTDEEWQVRIRNLIRDRDSLLTIDDYENAVVAALGEGAPAHIERKLTPDFTYRNGFMTVFVLNPDRTPLSPAQLSQLEEDFILRSAPSSITVANLETLDLVIKVAVSVGANIKPLPQAEACDRAVRTYVNSVLPGKMVFNKAIEYAVQEVAGTMRGSLQVLVNEVAENVPMPNPWTIGRIQRVEVTVIPPDNNHYDFVFS